MTPLTTGIAPNVTLAINSFPGQEFPRYLRFFGQFHDIYLIFGQHPNISLISGQFSDTSVSFLQVPDIYPSFLSNAATFSGSSEKIDR